MIYVFLENIRVSAIIRGFLKTQFSELFFWLCVMYGWKNRPLRIFLTGDLS